MGRVMPWLQGNQAILQGNQAIITGQPGDQAQSAWVYEGQVLLDEPDLLLWQSLVDEGKAVDVVYLDFRRI